MNDDDVSDEGTPLPGNPALPAVVKAAPTDRTSMIDLEAVQAKRDARRAADGDEAISAQEGEEATAAPNGERERDPEATGTLARRPRKKGKGEFSRLVRDEQSRLEATEQEESPPENPEDGGAGGTRSSMTRPGTRTGMTRAGGTQALKRPVKKKPLSPVAAASVVAIVVVAVVVGVFVAVRATGVVTVTTVPLGAAVVLDGEAIGTSPLQKRVRTGSHVIELSLAGYEPFREVVAVSADGTGFLQPLKALPPPPPPPPTNAEIALDIMAQAKRLFDAGDLDGAAARVAEIEKLVPDHQPSVELRGAIKAALDKRAASASVRAANAAAEARLQKAKQLSDEGLRLYNAGKLGPARSALYDALKLDPKSPDPHRTLAKIFNREDEVDKVRYHLERFLALGGNDGDFKVREWLKAHPKR